MKWLRFIAHAWRLRSFSLARWVIQYEQHENQ
jgi:hypothetical protein